MKMQMKEQRLRFNRWWSQLAARERQAMVMGGAALFLFIVYQWVWSPMLSGKQSLKARIEAQTKTYVWMQAADHTITKIEKQQAHHETKAVTPVVLLGVMQKEIELAGLQTSLSQLKQSTNESIEVHFQKVVFDKLMQLLIKILKTQSVTVSQMTVTAESTPGLVTAEVTLKLG